MAPTLPFLVGAGLVVSIPAALAGFAAVVRTDRSPRLVGAAVLATVAAAYGAVVAFPPARVVPVATALAVLVAFPVYALFWTLHDFVETTVR